jgi:hypothetical protein
LITDIIITLDKINIALRSSWNKEFSAEDGNGMYFVALLQCEFSIALVYHTWRSSSRQMVLE